ncbi:MAG: hypothetical protein CPSOU_2540 [uncultured Paraburkholderia sp.]|nr:MAG: hypothetical protein CPSOU_2540 [uncultured Paraburkholderia sp.]
MAWRQFEVQTCITLSLLGHAIAGQSQPSIMQFRQHEEAQHNRPTDKPEVNASPRSSLVISGHKDPGIEIWFDLSYGTTIKQCNTQSVANRMLGAPDVPQAVIDSIQVPAGQTEFSVRFFLDRYLPGGCNWQPMGLGHAEFEPALSQGPTVSTGVVSIRPNGKRSTELAWVCQRAKTFYSSGGQSWLKCHTKQRVSNEQATISTKGGVVDVEFTLETGAGSPANDESN